MVATEIRKVCNTLNTFIAIEFSGELKINHHQKRQLMNRALKILSKLNDIKLLILSLSHEFDQCVLFVGLSRHSPILPLCQGSHHVLEVYFQIRYNNMHCFRDFWPYLSLQNRYTYLWMKMNFFWKMIIPNNSSNLRKMRIALYPLLRILQCYF